MARIDTARLKAMKFEIDPPADELAAHFIHRGQDDDSDDRDVGTPSDLFHATLVSRYAADELVDHRVMQWMAEQPDLPDWADPERLHNGAAFFAEWGVELGLGLFLSSLPLAYASSDGAQVLALTARLETDANRRVVESAQFLLDVTKDGALEPGAGGYDAARLVRLMHAGVRHLIQHDARFPKTSDATVWPRWDPEWGEPINQQHLIGAMLSFSSSLLHVLDAFEATYDAQGADDYCLLWNVVGWLLGIDPTVLPMDREEMDRLEIEIRQLNERESEAGRQMTAALLALVQSYIKVPGLRGYPATLMRLLIGDTTADLLAVPPANWTRVFTTTARELTRRLSLQEAHGRVQRVVVRWASMRVLNGFVQHERHGSRPTFSIPTSLGVSVKTDARSPLDRAKGWIGRA